MVSEKLQIDLFFNRIIKSDFPVLCFFFQISYDETYVLVFRRNKWPSCLLEFYLERSPDYASKRRIALLAERSFVESNFKEFSSAFREVFTKHGQFSTPDSSSYYRWWDRESYCKAFLNIETTIRRGNNGEIWSIREFGGLIIKCNEYKRRYSDFGSDNEMYVIRGDAKYGGMVGKGEIYHHENPRGDTKTWTRAGGDMTTQSHFDEKASLSQNAFDFFYDRRELILENYDLVPFEFGRYFESGPSITGPVFPGKLFSPPSYLIEKSFVLTTQFEQNAW